MIRVLIIDDDDEVRLMLRTLLDDDGRFAEVVEASDALTGLDLAAKTQPDTIVLDQSMPRLNGTEVLPRLRALCPSARIVMWSSVGLDINEAIRDGATACIPKTSPISTLLDAMTGDITIDLSDTQQIATGKTPDH